MKKKKSENKERVGEKTAKAEEKKSDAMFTASDKTSVSPTQKSDQSSGDRNLAEEDEGEVRSDFDMGEWETGSAAFNLELINLKTIPVIVF